MFDIPIANLNKAKKIIENLDNKYFDNKKGLLNSEVTTLYLNSEDIYFHKPGIYSSYKKQLLQILTNNKTTTIIDILNISDDKRKKLLLKTQKS